MSINKIIAVMEYGIAAALEGTNFAFGRIFCPAPEFWLRFGA